MTQRYLHGDEMGVVLDWLHRVGDGPVTVVGVLELVRMSRAVVREGPEGLTYESGNQIQD